MIEDTPRMLLIDGHGLVYRGYYALPDTLTAPDGVPTNAIVGFTNMLYIKNLETKTQTVVNINILEKYNPNWFTDDLEQKIKFNNVIYIL